MVWTSCCPSDQEEKRSSHTTSNREKKTELTNVPEQVFFMIPQPKVDCDSTSTPEDQQSNQLPKL